jgi:hypothetical protein
MPELIDFYTSQLRLSGALRLYILLTVSKHFELHVLLGSQ